MNFQADRFRAALADTMAMIDPAACECDPSATAAVVDAIGATGYRDYLCGHSPDWGARWADCLVRWARVGLDRLRTDYEREINLP